MSNVVIWLGVAIVLLLVSVVLVMAEAALGRTSAVRIEGFADTDPKRTERVIGLLDAPEAILNPLRLVIVIVELSQATLVALAAADNLRTLGVLAVAAVNAAILFVLAEAGGRTFGIQHADRVSLVLAGPVASLVGSPPVRLLARAMVGLSNIIVPGKGLTAGPFAHPEEFIAMADAAVEDAVLEQGERDLIESVIEFGDTIVREVMVPRTDMVTVEQTLTVAETLEIASDAGFSRLPAEGENIDDIVGLVFVKDLIRAELDGGHDLKISEFLRPARFVPESKKVSQLLREMQADSFHMAVAVDEYGGVAGIATLEDLIEELVGEIVDEYDVRESMVERQRDGSLRVDARILIDEINDVAGFDLPEGDWDTVGGLVFDRFGRVPAEGERCESDGFLLEVERIQGRRITRVRITKPANTAVVDQREANRD